VVASLQLRSAFKKSASMFSSTSPATHAPTIWSRRYALIGQRRCRCFIWDTQAAWAVISLICTSQTGFKPVVLTSSCASSQTTYRFSSPVEFRRHYDEALLYATAALTSKLHCSINVTLSTDTCPVVSLSTTTCSHTAGC
jgi:hypothetical protein